VPARACTVSFTDPEGFRNAVEVNAGSLYEAVGLAIQAFREHDCAPGSAALLEIEVCGPRVKHSVNMLRVREWANGPCKSPSQKLVKELLKELLAS
jgi:hypothetical protein